MADKVRTIINFDNCWCHFHYFGVSDSEAGSGTAPGVYLKEDPISGTQLENQSELRAPTAQSAAYYLDAAIAMRTIPGECRRYYSGRFLFIIV